jgi:AmmeMemoRadiSam system protein B
MRDGMGYSDATLVIPPPLVAVLELFDGESTEADLRLELNRITGELDTAPLAAHLTRALSEAAFLEDETFMAIRREVHEAFAASPVREPAHAGAAYPADVPGLNAMFDHYFAGSQRAASASRVMAIAAPHVSPEGGWESYRDAYAALPSEAGNKTFVILGTSHYGAPDRFGLTRKPYRTPLGDPRVDLALVDELLRAAPDSVKLEDYCHAVEHSIEFQVLFLQRMFGSGVRVAPILCGAFAESIYGAHQPAPEANPRVERFFGALGELAARRQDELVFVLGIDMAHLGRRYGDPFDAVANQGLMEGSAMRDQARIERIQAGDARGFWDRVQEQNDDLKWCGSAPLYTFLKTVPGARGELLRYQQWNIDPRSVVSFAAMRFEL